MTVLLFALTTVGAGCACEPEPGAGGPEGGGSDGGGSSTPDGSRPPTPPPSDGVIDLVEPTATGAAPALAPRLLALTYAGGPGDQHVHAVSFDADGTLRAEGSAFTVLHDADGANGRIEGDVALADTRAFAQRPRLPGDPGQPYRDLRHGLVYTVGYRQAGSSLQMPIFRAFEDDVRIWSLWGHAVMDVLDRNLGADSRCYQAWAMPDGHVGVQCWTDGGNSVLAKEPRDLDSPGFNPSWAAGSFQPSAGGMSSLYARIDPRDGGSVVSGTFAASHVAAVAVDPWGRVYVARVASSRSGGGDPQNPFAQAESATSGVLVLDPTLRQVLFNARIGGACSGEGTVQAFGSIAVREDGLLILGGSTCAPDLGTTSAAQASHGGGQDGMVAVLRLWER
jgi:hypothetical protein